MKGWLKDKFDIRDYPHRAYRYGAAQVPDIVNLSALLAPRLNQDGMNGCVGAALRTAICATAKSLDVYSEDESWIWPWNGARAIEGTLSQNVGVYPRDAFTWLVDNGCLFEQYWPFSGRFDASAPSSDKMLKAIKYSDFAYYRVGDGVAGIMESLAESYASWRSGGPAWLICLGSPWPRKWDVAPAGVLGDITPDDEMSDGHETVIYGYSKTLERLYICNSWGPDWGANGLASLPFGALPVFKSLGGYDAQYLCFKASPVPVEKSGCNPISSLMSLFKR